MALGHLYARGYEEIWFAIGHTAGEILMSRKHGVVKHGAQLVLGKTT